MKPTRTESTKKQYSERAVRLAKAAANHYGHDPNAIVYPDTIIDYLIARAPEWSKRTVRLQKAAVRYWIESAIAENPGVELLPQALKRLEVEVGGFLAPPRKETVKRTSALKLKRVRHEDLEKLEPHMIQTTDFWKPRAMRFLQASIVTGLRPGEWKNAELISDTMLLVRNAKNTNGRSHGSTRTIPLDPEHWLYEATLMHVGFLQHWIRDGNAFEDYYESCRFALLRACKRLWPKREGHYTLYSGRHQFCANAKAESSKDEVAWLMGHGSDETAGEFYGRRRAAWPSKLRPSAIKPEQGQSPNTGNPGQGQSPER